jgi:hypothetical protein
MLNNEENNKLIHPFSEESNEIPIKKIAFVFFLVAFLGVFTGFLIFRAKKLWLSNQGQAPQQLKKAKEAVGIQDKKTFKDHAEGILREGGIDGEGQFHLERPGGESQNVYLTSTTVDLSQYLGKKVRVWGETFAAQKAGWLMDVGLVEIL